MFLKGASLNYSLLWKLKIVYVFLLALTAHSLSFRSDLLVHECNCRFLLEWQKKIPFTFLLYFISGHKMP